MAELSGSYESSKLDAAEGVIVLFVLALALLAILTYSSRSSYFSGLTPGLSNIRSMAW